MTPPSPDRLRTPEEIALRAGLELPRLLTPEAAVFAERALRLRERAAGHPLRDYLLLMALVCEAQHERLAAYPVVSLPTPEQADAAALAGQPLLPATEWPRDPRWRSQWRALLDRVLTRLPADSPARAGLQAARALGDEALEQQADRLLAGITLGLDMALAPLLAAGLQVHFTHLVRASAAAQPQPFGLVQDASRCPCCGSLPTASVTRVGGEREGHRYLHCSLCSTQWHMVRVKCAHCQSTVGIHYQSLQPEAQPERESKREAIQAETCDTCGHYLKILHMERDLHVEPVADDLASLTLDLLVSEAGFVRHGVNLMLLFGDPQADSQAEPAPASSKR